MIKKIMRGLQSFGNDYLELNPNEIRAFPRLLLILVFLIALPTIIRFLGQLFYPSPLESAFKPFPIGYEMPEAILDTGIFAHYKPKKQILFYFNPNNLSTDSLQLLGLHTWLAGRVERYRLRYPFRIRNDFRRVYGLQDSLYRVLEPYILLPDTFARRSYPKFASRFSKGFMRPTLALLDINRADTFLFTTLRGIGKSYARRIVAYRTRLGGFVDKNQLYEVWGIDSSAVDSLIDRCLIDPNFRPVQLSLNRAKEPDLATHPYMPRRLARIIMQYRLQHGSFKNTQDLMNVQILKVQDFERLKPYLFADSSEQVVLPEVQIYKPKDGNPNAKKWQKIDSISGGKK